jgi:hypothetical protein
MGFPNSVNVTKDGVKDQLFKDLTGCSVQGGPLVNVSEHIKELRQ